MLTRLKTRGASLSEMQRVVRLRSPALAFIVLRQIYSTLRHSSTLSSLKYIFMYDRGGCNVG
jgi:hypothetical protein